MEAYPKGTHGGRIGVLRRVDSIEREELEVDLTSTSNFFLSTKSEFYFFLFKPIALEVGENALPEFSLKMFPSDLSVSTVFRHTLAAGKILLIVLVDST